MKSLGEKVEDKMRSKHVEKAGDQAVVMEDWKAEIKAGEDVVTLNAGVTHRPGTVPGSKKEHSKMRYKRWLEAVIRRRKFIQGMHKKNSPTTRIPDMHSVAAALLKSGAMTGGKA